MKRTTQVLLTTLIFCTFIAEGFSQGNQFIWPEDPATRAKAQEKYTYMTDLIKAKKYATAKPNFDWLLQNNPKLNVALYQHGSKIYEGLARTEKDKTKKTNIEDTALLIYDLRIKLYGKEAYVLNRKGLKAWPYLINRKGETENLYNLYSKILELNGDKTYSSNLVYLMDLSCKMKDDGKITEEKVMEHYEKATAIIDANIAAGDTKETAYKERIDKEFMSCVKIDCDFVKNKIEPKYKANPDDVKMAKKYYGMINSVNCEENDLYYQALELIVTTEPSPGGIISTARSFKKGNRYDKALEYFNKALGLEELAVKKAEIYYEMAEIYANRGMKEQAREYAQKSISAGDSHRGQAYILIGNLYFGSVKDCDPKSVVVFRARYIAAYEMFKNGGYSSGMEKCKAQFPSVNEMFQENYKVGDVLDVGCWMNEKVTLQSRD